MPSISLGQQKVLAIVPKITGSLSLVGSLFVLQDILRDKKKRSKSIFHKIMIGLSTSDVISSVANVLSTWPSPSNGDHNSSVYGAVGTTATCTAQGFFNELGSLTTPLYTASLCLRYLLVVRYNWRESQLQKYEALFHMIPIAIGCTMSIVGLPLNLYNNVGWICWFAAYPGGCTVDCSCTRGELAHTFQWIHFGFVWSAIAFVTVSMLLIYLKVRDRERRAQFLNEDQTASSMMHSVADTPSEESTMRRISRLLSFTNLTTSTGESREQRGARKRITNTKKVVIQASLYVGALYLTWIFATVRTKSMHVFIDFQIPLLRCCSIPLHTITCLPTYSRTLLILFSSLVLLTVDEDLKDYPKQDILWCAIAADNIPSATGRIQCFHLREAAVSQEEE